MDNNIEQFFNIIIQNPSSNPITLRSDVYTELNGYVVYPGGYVPVVCKKVPGLKPIAREQSNHKGEVVSVYVGLVDEAF